MEDSRPCLGGNQMIGNSCIPHRYMSLALTGCFQGNSGVQRRNNARSGSRRRHLGCNSLYSRSCPMCTTRLPRDSTPRRMACINRYIPHCYTACASSSAGSSLIQASRQQQRVAGRAATRRVRFGESAPAPESGRSGLFGDLPWQPPETTHGEKAGYPTGLILSPSEQFGNKL